METALKAGDELTCPACHGRVTLQPVPAPPGVSYVRHRVWALCVDCKRSAALDLKS